MSNRKIILLTFSFLCPSQTSHIIWQEVWYTRGQQRTKRQHFYVTSWWHSRAVWTLWPCAPQGLPFPLPPNDREQSGDVSLCRYAEFMKANSFFFLTSWCLVPVFHVLNGLLLLNAIKVPFYCVTKHIIWRTDPASSKWTTVNLQAVMKGSTTNVNVVAVICSHQLWTQCV